MLNLLDQKLTLTDQEFEQVSDLVYEHCGINLHDGKKELVRSRLAKLLRLKQMSSYSEYLDYVMNDTSGTAFSELIDAISTNLTSFFRESDHFDYLRNHYLPDLVEKNSTQRIRCWSAGCSSGEEPYSIAITLLDTLPGAERLDIKILATDISTRILKSAQQGLYDPERVAPVPAPLKNRYLLHRKQNGRSSYEVSHLLRERIVFKYLNLMTEFPFTGPFNFIFCRNVMIYFDKPTQQRLIERYWKVLSPGGLLFTGHSESLTGIKHDFRYVQPTIYRKG